MPAGTATTRARPRPGRRQLERGGQRLEDQGEGGHLVLEREPEVAADGAGEEAQVLDPQRIVEPEQRAELPDVLLARLERQEQPRRIAGEVQEPEDDHRDAEQNEQALQEPPQDVGEHARAPLSRRFPGGDEGETGRSELDLSSRLEADLGQPDRLVARAAST